MTVPSVDEGDGVDAVIGAAGPRGALDPVPDHLLELAVDFTRVALGAEVFDVEGSPADDVVLGVRTLALESVVDREEQRRVLARLHSALHARRLEVGARPRVVAAE